MDKSTKAICPYFYKIDSTRIKCEGFCNEVSKFTLEFETKKQRQEWEENFCNCRCWKGCGVAKMIEEKYRESK